jgi:UDP-N-acetylglucosamine/UDP-N-acetylgalactosamine diphosphorylase
LADATFDSLAGHLQKHRQEHVLRFWHELSPEQRQALGRQIQQLDLAELAVLFPADDSPAESPAAKALRAVPPAQLVRARGRKDGDDDEWTAARKTGEELLRAGRVGAILVAGGEGTRLGFPRPKGGFPIGALSGKTLFQLLAEQVVARARRAGKSIPYYVMTSHATHDDTVAFFEQQRHFGLPRGDVQFFCQGTMPAVDRASGQLLLAAKHELALNPDGHGGILAALGRASLLDEMRRR